MQIKRTTSTNRDFIQLVKELDAYLAIIDGDEHSFYDQFNNIDVLKHVVLVYNNQKAVGCAAIKHFTDEDIEIKRMFVLPEVRGKGYSQKIINELETWANELGYKRCILETGVRQVDAISFYKKCKYQLMPNYGPYKGVKNSLCFEKQLI